MAGVTIVVGCHVVKGDVTVAGCHVVGDVGSHVVGVGGYGCCWL